MRKLDVSTTKEPFGIKADPLHGSCARLSIKCRTGEELVVDLSRAASESLRDQLSAALDHDGAE